MAWKALVAPRKGTTDGPGWCLRFAQSFFGAPVRYDSAWEAWEHTQHRHGPDVPLPDVPVLLWFSHYGSYGTPPAYGNWGHVTPYVPGDAIYSSPMSGWAVGQARVGTIPEIERAIGARYVGWSEDINGLRIAEYTPDPAPIPEPDPTQGEDEMSKPMIAQKLDGGPMNTLGVMIEPDGTVVALDIAQWEFWRDRVGCVPVECKNPGHWEYLMGVMAKRRARANIVISDAELKRITAAIRDTAVAASSEVTAQEVAKLLQITVG